MQCVLRWWSEPLTYPDGLRQTHGGLSASQNQSEAEFGDLHLTVYDDIIQIYGSDQKIVFINMFGV